MKKIILYIFFLIIAVNSFSQNNAHYLPLGSPVGNSIQATEILKQAVIPTFSDTTTANSMFGGSTGRIDLVGSLIAIKTSSSVFLYSRDTVSTGGHKWTLSGAGFTPTFQQTLDVTNGNILTHDDSILSNYKVIVQGQKVIIRGAGGGTITLDNGANTLTFGELNGFYIPEFIGATTTGKAFNVDSLTGRLKLVNVSGGGGGGSQNLQQVTDIGNSTTDRINIYNSRGLNVYAADSSAFSQLSVGGINWQQVNGSMALDPQALYNDYTLQLPDYSGVLASQVRVNGTTHSADSTGLVDLGTISGGGGGTVTSVSVVTANGLSGTVANPTTTPAITLSTTVTGILKGNGTAISAATAGTDYQAPITLTTTGTSGAATFVSNVLNIPNYAGGSGLTYPNTPNTYLNGYGNFPVLNADTVGQGVTHLFTLASTTAAYPTPVTGTLYDLAGGNVVPHTTSTVTLGKSIYWAGNTSYLAPVNNEWYANASVIGYGNSIMAGFPSLNLDSQFLQKAVLPLGTAFPSNTAVSGTTMDAISRLVYGFTPANINVFQGGENDYKNSALATAALTNYKAMLLHMIVWTTSRNILNGQTGTFTTPTDWTNDSIDFKYTIGTRTTVNNSPVTFNLGGSVLYTTIGYDSASNVTFTVTIDGTLMGTYTANSYPYTPIGQNGNNNFIPFCLRFPNLSNLIHTIVIQKTGGAGFLKVNYVASNLNPYLPYPVASGRRAVVVAAFKMTQGVAGSSGYAYWGGNDTLATLWDVNQRNIANTASQDGLPVVEFNPNENYNPYIDAQPDGLHPSPSGHTKIAFGLRQALTQGMLPQERTELHNFVRDIKIVSPTNIGINTATPNPSALLDLTDTLGGLLIPRMTTTQRNAIATPATSLLIYNTTVPEYEYYNGSTWVTFGGGGTTSISTVPDSSLYSTLSGSNYQLQLNTYHSDTFHVPQYFNNTANTIAASVVNLTPATSSVAQSSSALLIGGQAYNTTSSSSVGAGYLITTTSMNGASPSSYFNIGSYINGTLTNLVQMRGDGSFYLNGTNPTFLGKFVGLTAGGTVNIGSNLDLSESHLTTSSTDFNIYAGAAGLNMGAQFFTTASTSNPHITFYKRGSNGLPVFNIDTSKIEAFDTTVLHKTPNWTSGDSVLTIKNGVVEVAPYSAFSGGGGGSGTVTSIATTSPVTGGTITTTGTLGLDTTTAGGGWHSRGYYDGRYQGALTLTTTGTSGAATLTGNTLNIPNYAGGTTFANPTALAGLTAVNGTATTAMRSDAAPAIDQSIVPTWTGSHTFSADIQTHNINPTSSGTYNLGLSTFTWNNIYANNYHSAATNVALIFSRGATESFRIAATTGYSVFTQLPATNTETNPALMVRNATSGNAEIITRSALSGLGVIASNDLTAQTTAGTVTSVTSAATASTYDIGAYLNVTAISTDIIQVQITYTDENNTAQTVSFTTLSTVTNSTYNPVTIRVKASTTITLKTNLTVGTGSVTYDAGGYIKKDY